MGLITVFLIAAGLAMDAFSVCISAGICIPKINAGHYLRLSLAFGFFQFLMPLIGYAAGITVEPVIKNYDHWIAFVLLGGIGAKMIWEAMSAGDESDTASDPFALRPMLLLAVATSIDALVVGVTLPMLGAPLLLSIGTIGVATALLSALGLYAGRIFGKLLGKRLDFLGGLVLVGLGTKILLEHLLAGSP